MPSWLRSLLGLSASDAGPPDTAADVTLLVPGMN
jgi:hypothetical protein